jgi:hypothetical protein
VSSYFSLRSFLTAVFLLFVGYIGYYQFYIPIASAVSGPTTTASISAQSTQGSNGWYTSAVDVTLTATYSAGATNAAQIKNITYWLDSNPPATVSGNTTNQIFAQAGSHTLNFFATDINDIEELPHKTLAFKIDTVSPKNWRNFTANRQGNSHTFSFGITVDDITSGLNTSNLQMQYSVDDGATWGYYQNLTSCSSSWINGGWMTLSGQSFSNGATSGTITTPIIDVCNSNWDQCKIIKYRVGDMAGNFSEQKICIFGAWMKSTGGDVYSVGPINMQAGATQTSASDIVQTAGSITNFNSVNNWYMPNYTVASDFDTLDYIHFYPKVSSQAQQLPGGKIPGINGYYHYNGDLTITSTLMPAAVSNVKNVAVVLFINGDLSINTNINLDPSTVIMFVPLGDISIDKSVTSISGIYVSDGEIDTAYNGNTTPQLTVNGMMYSLNGFNLSRSLSNQDNNTMPAELFNFMPSYLMNRNFMSLISGTAKYTWKELITY